MVFLAGEQPSLLEEGFFIYRQNNDHIRSMSVTISLSGSTLIILNVQYSVLVESVVSRWLL